MTLPTPDATASPPDPVAPLWARPRVIAGALIILVLLVFGRILFSDFTWWDDQDTIHHNARLNPPTLGSLAYYWTTMTLGLYVPVTYTVWILLAHLAYVQVPDVMGVTLNPIFFHGASVLCHAASAVLAFQLLRRLLPDDAARRSIVPATVGALLFALHPVQVETVGWASGLKDLLCWLGVFAVALLYVRRVQSVASDPATPPTRSAWGTWELPAAALVMVLAILSKPTAFVAPAVLLAIDLLALRRPVRRALRDVAPFAVISVGGMILARIAQTTTYNFQTPVLQRPLVVGDSYCFYILKWLWPATLTPDYGRTPQTVLASGWVYVRWLLPAAVAIALFSLRRRAPLLALGGLLFAIPLAPISGITPFQMQQISTVTDHYLYFASFGAALVGAWLAWRFPVAPVQVALALAIAALAAQTWRQSAIWKDSYALFDATIRRRPDSVMARSNLVVLALGKLHPDVPTALKYADEAYRIAPEDPNVIWNYSVVHARVRDMAIADDAMERAWRAASDNSDPAQRFEMARMASQLFDDVGDGHRALRWADRMAELQPWSGGEAQRLRHRALDWIAEEDAKRAATRAASPAATNAPAATTAPAPAAASRP